MAQIKTTIQPIDPLEFINNIDNDVRKSDALVILGMMQEITGHRPKMWGPSIIGFDKYQYTYESGHSGEMCKIGFSPRKAANTLYLMLGATDFDDELSRLGKHTIGKGCLYIKNLKDIDLQILAEIIKKSYKQICIKYP